MATHASALKAHRQSLIRRERNRQLRSKLRTQLKAVRATIAANDRDGSRRSLQTTLSVIDKMVAKGIIHKNAGGRYKSRLTKHVERLG